MVARAVRIAVVAGVMLAGAILCAQTPLTPGNLVVERIGNGSAALTSGSTPVFLDTFTPAVVASGTFSLPNAASRPSGSPYNLTDSGTEVSAGQLTRSAEGLYIMLPGYNGIAADASDPDPLISNIAFSDASVIGRAMGFLDGAGTMYTLISLNVASGSTFRSMVSDGNGFWAATSGLVASSDGVSATSLTVAGQGDSRAINIFNHTLFASTRSSAFGGAGSNLGLWQVGTAGTLPLAGTPTLYNIVNTGAGSTPSAFQFNTGMTVAYIADERASSSGGIQKWTSNGSGTWTLQYTLGTGAANVGARGLAVDWSNPSAPVLYGTSAEASNNRMFKITDTGSGSAVTASVSAGANKVFRGVDFALLPSVWTSSSSGNWGSATTTTYSSSVGAAATKYNNWSTGIERGSNIVFQKVNAASLALTNNLGTTLESSVFVPNAYFSSINFSGQGFGSSNTAYTLTGDTSNPVYLNGTDTTGSGITNNSTVTQTLNLQFQLGNDAAFTANNGDFVFGGVGVGIDLNGRTLTVQGARNTTISTQLTNGGTFLKNGTGTLTLTGNNTFVGPVTINQGTAIAGAVGAFGGATSVQVNSGGILRLSAVGDHINNAAGLTLAGGTLDLNGLSEGVAGTNGVGALTLSATSTIDFGAGNNSNVIQFAGVSGTPSGTLQITNWNGTAVTGGGSERLLFAGTASAFTSVFTPSMVTFNGVPGYTAVQSSGYYEITFMAISDTTPPDTTITGGPPAVTGSTTATITFTGSDNVTAPGSLTFEGKLDAGAYGVVTSPVNLSGLAGGTHTYSVRAKDAAGNLDATPASVTWTVDVTAPSLSPVAVASNNASTAKARQGDTVTVSFTASEAIQTPVVTLLGVAASVANPGGNNWTAAATVGAGTAEGAATFSITATDVAGNAAAAVTATTNASSVTVDLTAPDTTITGGPLALTTSTTATITFTGSDNLTAPASLAFQGRLDGAAYATVTSPVNLSSVPEGVHTYAVRAIDAAGNVDATPASVSWTVDTTAPVVTPPANVIAEATSPSGATVTYPPATATDAVTASPTIGYSKASGTVFALGTTVVTISATDGAGNTGFASFNVTVTMPTTIANWRSYYFGSSANSGAGADSADPDGDGQNNLSEFVAGTIPTDPTSRFRLRIEAVPGQPTQRRIVFSPRLTDRTYAVTYKTALSDPTWTTLTNLSLSDNGQERTVTDLGPTGSRRFYRVEISKP